MTKMDKKRRNLLIIGVLVVLFTGIFVTVYPLMPYYDDGGGGVTDGEVPSIPNLEPIFPDPDYDGSIYLNWNFASGAQGYQLWMMKDSDPGEIIKTTIFTDFTKTDLTSGYYVFKVRAYNEIGDSRYSVAQFVTVIISGEDLEEIPDAPVLNTIEGPSTTGDIYLSWNDVSDATYYEVYRSSNGGAYSVIYPTTEKNYYDDSLRVDGTYSYKVKAGNNMGTSDFSNEQSVVVRFPIILEPPVEPILDSIVPETSNNGAISLSWDVVSDATYYEVYRSYDAASFELLETLSDNCYEDLILDNGVYSYKIKSGNNVGNSDFSNAEYVVVYITESPPEPQLDDYAWLYVLFIVLGVAVFSVVILKRKGKKAN